METAENKNKKQKSAARQAGGRARAHDGRPGKSDRSRRAIRRKRQKTKDARSDLEQKVVNIRRVTRVVAGGRRFSFSVVVIAGDKNGSVGVGIGKGSDTATAIEKAVRSAKKNMTKVKTTDTMSIPHEVDAKYSSARVRIIPVPGRGLIAGSSVRSVLDIAGITDVTAKVLSRSKNKLNIAQAAVKALKQF